MKEQYPVLGDRPINQWKVTELKDELKRRGLAVKGLKNDLIKRLAEAIREEGGDSEGESSDAAGTEDVHDDNCERPDVTNNGDMSDPVPINNGTEATFEEKVHVVEPTNDTADIGDVDSKVAQVEVQEEEAVGDMINVGDLPDDETAKEVVQEENIAVSGRVDDGPSETDQGKLEKEIGETDSLRSVAEEQVTVTSSASRTVVDETVIFQTSPVDEKSERKILELHEEPGNSPADAVMVTERTVIEVSGGATDLVNGIEETSTAASETPMENTGNKMDNEHSGSLEMDVVLNEQAPNNQVLVPAEPDKGKVEEEISGTDSFRPVTEEPVLATCETLIVETSPVDEDSERNEMEPAQELSEILPTDDVVIAEKTDIEVPMEAINLENGTTDVTTVASKKCMENNGSKMVNEPSESLQKDVLLNEIAPNNQVHEVSPSVGNQVKFESISPNSVSVFEKSELKDNLNAADVHLEIDAVKEEIEQPSSSGFPDDGNFHPPEDEKSHSNEDFSRKTDNKKSTVMDISDGIISGDVSSSMISKVEHNVVDDLILENFENKAVDLVHKSTEVTDLSGTHEKDGKDSAELGLSSDKMETYAKGTALIDEMKPQGKDPSARTHVEDEGPFERINVDPSSTDDSMEEDTAEVKQLVSNPKSVEVANIESTELSRKKYETIDTVGCDASALDKMEISSQRTGSTTSPGKRKFQDEIETNNKETPKRQRNLNPSVPTKSESPRPSFSAGIKNLSPKTKLNITKADSVALDAPKERIVPPSRKPPTNSLRIDHFLRPFTLKAAQQLLSTTGKVCSFWMDQIKTHCYVTYSSIEEAVETRNSVYNLKWPPNGGRLLVADFVDPEDVKSRVEAPSQPPAAPVGMGPTGAKSQPPIDSPSPARENFLKRSMLPEAPPIRQPPPPPSDLPRTRETLHVPPPPRAETLEPPIVALDELFRKTRAMPRIYYLPLTDEEVAIKLGKK